MAGSDNVVYSPTWAVASVYFVFIVCSLMAERIIFKLGHYWRSRKKVALFEALEKIKEELMVVGFMSLALTVGQTTVSKICVPKSWSTFQPLCKRTDPYTPEKICPEKDKAPFMDKYSLHQLHVFIFVLALVHVVYSVITMAIGMWRVHRWSRWEEESRKTESEISHGELRYAKESTFIRRHVTGKWSKNIIFSHIAAFFQQFFRSVSFTDYLTLRHGFIKNFNLDQKFNFHEYIKRSMETDFEHVVGISPLLWAWLVVLTLLNMEGWGMLYWASLIPFIMVLILGTKLRQIITQMAILCLNKDAVIENIPAVKPSDDLFWFKKPRLILYAIHFILFQDAHEVAIQIWSYFSFNATVCINQDPGYIAGRLLIGVVTQILCGYVVLPIYALVSQMGSEMKKHHGEMEMGSHHGEMEMGSHEDKSVGAKVNGHTEGEDSIVEVDRSQLRRMSYNERMTRGIHGEDYYKLNTSTPSAPAPT